MVFICQIPNILLLRTADPFHFYNYTVIFMKILYEIELLKTYQNQSKINMKIETKFLAGTVSIIVCIITFLFQLSIMEKFLLVREKINLEKICNRFSIQIQTYFYDDFELISFKILLCLLLLLVCFYRGTC